MLARELTADGTAKVDYGANLSATSACEYDGDGHNNDVANETNVNANAFFGTNTWDDLGKTDLPDGAGQNGSWALPVGFNFALFDYLNVFKDGRNTSLIGFLLNEEAASGS
jgi:hypothetical protein